MEDAPRPARLETARRDRYLRLLGASPRPPSLEALSELVSAQLARVPFENLSKVLRWRRQGLTGLPDLDSYLEGAERFHLGGTCYANNYHLYTLLLSLGYQARLCGADMSEPDVHLVIAVALEGGEYLVDAGYAAPLVRPLPLDAPAVQVIAHGRDRYLLAPRDPAGRSRLEFQGEEGRRHGYLVKPEARRIEEFEGAIARSFLPGATFLRALLLARFQPGRSVVIRNLEVVRVEDGRVSKTPLPDRRALAEEIERSFGIPGSLAGEVLADLPGLQDPWA